MQIEIPKLLADKPISRKRTELAWLAGLVDGEGCITIASSALESRYVVSLSISMTSAEAIEAAARIGGGNPTLTFRPKRKRAHKGVYLVRWLHKPLRDLLMALRPYLVVKRAQADLAIKFCETIMELVPGRTKKLTDETVRVRQQLRGEIRRLNHRGAVSTYE